MKKFIILTRGRTGSTIICDIIGKINGITCGQELLRPLDISELKDVATLFGQDQTIETIEDKLTNLPLLYVGNGCKKISYHFFDKLIPDSSIAIYYDYLEMNNIDTLGIGFKVLCNHLGDTWDSIGEGISHFSEEGVSVLYLQRRDIAREALSVVLAQSRKIFNVEKGDTTKDLKRKISVDIDSLKNEIAYINNAKENLLKLLNANNVNFQEYFFEDFLNNRKQFLYTVLNFIGIDEPMNLLDNSDITNDGFIKVTPDVISDIIENYEEVMMCISYKINKI